MSIEITRECPLRCPGCYAYEPNHLGNAGVTLRQLSDYKGDELVRRVLQLVDREKPLHLSIVGGDPLVRYRELDVLVPQLLERGIFVQIVTSAFRPINPSFALLKNMQVVVSIDGLQPEHDVRRKPATYDRIIRNIEGHEVVVHCTITSAMTKRPGYIEEFVREWSPRKSVKKIWFSIFTPQIGENPPECLTQDERRAAIGELMRLRGLYPKIDMKRALLLEYLEPPKSPGKCIFAQTTRTISADLRTEIKPCQLGGAADCTRCGCIASMGLAAVGHHKVIGPLTAGDLFFASLALGRKIKALGEREQEPELATEPFHILQNPGVGD
jgi:MoaA/NifB/PqqE/SkfB family radical SAM enzyme